VSDEPRDVTYLLANLMAIYPHHSGTLGRALEEILRLRADLVADAERLDWLESHDGRLMRWTASASGFEWRVSGDDNKTWGHGSTPRAAIDMAMREDVP
jgi:hypothetical protein